MPASRSTLSAHHLVGEPWHLGIVRILGHVDKALMPARIDESGGGEMMHAKLAHIA
jgi:hypothetical protein